MEPDVTFVQEVKVQNAEIAVVKEVAIKPSLTTETVVKLAEVATNAPASSLSVEPMDKTAAKSREVEAAGFKLMDASPTTNPMALKPELDSDSSDDEELETEKLEIMKSATDESNSDWSNSDWSNSEVSEGEARELARKKLYLSRTPSPAKDKVCL